MEQSRKQMNNLSDKLAPRLVEDVEEIIVISEKVGGDFSPSQVLYISYLILYSSIKAYFKKQGFWQALKWKLNPKYSVNWLRRNLNEQELVELNNRVNILEGRMPVKESKAEVKKKISP